jgi:hypothetical protein
MTKLLLALPLIMLAACGSSPEVKVDNAKPSEVAQEMQQAGTANFLNPGKWQHTATLVEMNVPGMPPEVRSMMQNAGDRVKKFEHCLTPEQAKKPSADFFAQADQDCRYEHFKWGGGKIDMKLICTLSGGSRMTMVQTGEYQRDAYSMEMTQVIENAGAGAAGQMTMKANVDAKRVGDCDGKENVQIGN